MQRFLPPSTTAGDSIRFIVRSVGVGLIVLMALAMARPVLAGWVPAYVTASGRPDGVLLAWGTISEYNLSGFEILCKLESEPEDAFHPIGSRPAVGSLDAGADYQFLVNSGLEPGLTYCFRIRGIVFENIEEPHEYVDLCGYGININPPGAAEAPVGTPSGSVEVLSTAVFTTTPPPVQPIGGTPTPITINPAVSTGTVTAPATVIGAAPTLTPSPTVTPLPSPTPTQVGESPLQTGSDATTSPLGTPTQNPQSDAATSPLANQDSTAGDTGESPLLTAAQQQNRNVQSPLQSPSPTPTWTPMATATFPPSTGQVNTAVESPVGGGVAQSDDANPAYIVVTATPTAPETTPDATFTPLPTATPLPDSRLLATAADPTVENLILMTLCFIFLGAGGIGALGLTTTVLYIRSRNDRSR